MSLSNSKPHSFALLPTLAGFAAAQVTGFLWYGPLFGRQWLAAVKSVRPDYDETKNETKAYMGSAAVWLTSSICFTTLVEFWDRPSGGLLDYLCLAHTAWLGFCVPGHVFATLFTEQPATIEILGATYSLTAYTLMAVAHWLL